MGFNADRADVLTNFGKVRVSPIKDLDLRAGANRDDVVVAREFELAPPAGAENRRVRDDIADLLRQPISVVELERLPVEPADLPVASRGRGAKDDQCQTKRENHPKQLDPLTSSSCVSISGLLEQISIFVANSLLHDPV